MASGILVFARSPSSPSSRRRASSSCIFRISYTIFGRGRATTSATIDGSVYMPVVVVAIVENVVRRYPKNRKISGVRASPRSRAHSRVTTGTRSVGRRPYFSPRARWTRFGQVAPSGVARTTEYRDTRDSPRADSRTCRPTRLSVRPSFSSSLRVHMFVPYLRERECAR